MHLAKSPVFYVKTKAFKNGREQFKHFFMSCNEWRKEMEAYTVLGLERDVEKKIRELVYTLFPLIFSLYQASFWLRARYRCWCLSPKVCYYFANKISRLAANWNSFLLARSKKGRTSLQLRLTESREGERKKGGAVFVFIIDIITAMRCLFWQQRETKPEGTKEERHVMLFCGQALRV